MPVEIEELVIRVVVGPDPGRGGAGSAGGGGKADLVQETVDRLLEILEQKEER